jgi:hypothetical protein
MCIPFLWAVPAAGHDLVEDLDGAAVVVRQVGDEIAQVRLGQAGIQGDAEVGPQLAVEAGQGGDGGDLAALPVQVVAAEDVAEQVGFEELVDEGDEVEQRPGDRRAGQLGLVGGTDLDHVRVGGRRFRVVACRVGDAVGAALLEQGHEGAEGVEAARETRVGVHLHQDPFDLADAQPGFQSLREGTGQRWDPASRGEGGDAGSGPLLRVQTGHGHRTCLSACSYCSSVTGSSQVVGSPPSDLASSRARWFMKVSAVAPCQWSSSGGQTTVSPAWMRSTWPSRVPTRPTPSVTCRVCPTAWECQLVRAPAVNRTRAAVMRDGPVPA